MLRLFTSKNTFLTHSQRSREQNNHKMQRNIGGWTSSCLKARDYRELFKDAQKRNEIFFKMLEIWSLHGPKTRSGISQNLCKSKTQAHLDFVFECCFGLWWKTERDGFRHEGDQHSRPIILGGDAKPRPCTKKEKNSNIKLTRKTGFHFETSFCWTLDTDWVLESRLQAHPTTVFWKISVRRSKNCVDFFYGLGKAKKF